MPKKSAGKKSGKTLGRKTQKKTRGGALPRVGWEAPVGFAGGDPDRPLVLGQVPNPTKP